MLKTESGAWYGKIYHEEHQPLQSAVQDERVRRVGARVGAAGHRDREQVHFYKSPFALCSQ